MGKSDWSLDHLERDLSDGFALLGRAERAGGLAPGESTALADGVLACMSATLQKVSESIEAQASLRRELAVLREDLRRTSESAEERIAARDARLEALEAEVAALRRERDELRQTLAGLPETLAAASDPFPPADFLVQPLVLRTTQGDFLGITDRFGQPMSLADFLSLVERSGAADRVVGSVWERHGSAWCLTITIGGQGPRRCFTLEAEPCLTPSNNAVSRLAALLVDGRPAPDGYMLQLFRQLRDSLQE